MVMARTEWTEPGRVAAITKSAQALLKNMASDPDETCIWCLREVVWPGLTRDVVQEDWLEKVEIALVPLQRIGQMEGKSGSLVLIGRFWSKATNRPSNSLIVKTRRRTGSAVGLADEWARARAAKPHTYDRKDSFAIPVYFDDADPDYEVLWALCLPTVRESEAETTDFGSFPTVHDLRKLLAFFPRQTPDESSNNQREAALVLERTYTLLRNLHRSSAATGTSALAREHRTLGDEYAWYLRRYGFEPTSLWGPEWTVVWAPPTQRVARERINPLWLVDRLRREVVTMQVGLIHGDLHPGNIILREGDAPAIIDFGWSADRVHIAKDFVLMECNIRFLTLRPQVGDEELTAFTKALAWNAEPPQGLSEYLIRRWALVKVVREAARQVFASETDWTREYLAPLFLVAFGLLRFAPQLGNQRAAVGLVQELATTLASSLDRTEQAR